MEASWSEVCELRCRKGHAYLVTVLSWIWDTHHLIPWWKWSQCSLYLYYSKPGTSGLFDSCFAFIIAPGLFAIVDNVTHLRVIIVIIITDQYSAHLRIWPSWVLLVCTSWVISSSPKKFLRWSQWLVSVWSVQRHWAKREKLWWAGWGCQSAEAGAEQGEKEVWVHMVWVWFEQHFAEADP